MNINTLRVIGQRLKQEISTLIWELHGNTPVGKGASGDQTYPLDKRAEEIIFEEVEKLKIPLTIISEEYGVKDFFGGGARLLIDPIDGSKNAVSGLPLFSTAIAVVEGDTIEHTTVGYVVNLINGDEFWAIKNNGSFFNEKRIKTQQDEALNVILYEAQTPRRDIPKIMPLLSIFQRVRCLGSTALDMAFVAQGAVSMFVMPSPSRSFDFAAGHLLIKEAGGIVTDLDGRELGNVKIGVERASPLLSSANEGLHKKAIRALSGQI